MHSDAHGIQAMLARRVAEKADGKAIADVAVSTWCDIEAALAPIIGQQGVAALYKRSLYLSLVDHPCLVAAYEGSLRTGDFGGLKDVLALQTPAEALAAVNAQLNTFHELLAHLIGGSLLERLLRSVWDKPSSGDALTDTAT